MSTKTQARPLFAATLTPHRSLSRRGYRYAIALACIMATVPGIVFFSMGAWPIVGFLGLDLVAIWWALSSSMRSKAEYEEVTLWPDQLEVKQVAPGGKTRLSRFSPVLVKLVIDRDFNERVTGLHLRSGETDLVIGDFLSNDEKSSFAKVFGTALKKARH